MKRQEEGEEENDRLLEKRRSWKKAAWITAGAAAVTALLALIVFLVWLGLWVTLIDKHELGFSFDKVTGKIEVFKDSGWMIRTPIRYNVHTIDLRPYQVQISANQRILNAKLVQFNPDGLETFIKWHGRSAGDDTTGPNGLIEILKCYAFNKQNGKDCPFLTVLDEISPNQAGLPVQKTEAAK